MGRCLCVGALLKTLTVKTAREETRANLFEKFFAHAAPKNLFEKFLANRKAGKSDADYWAARKAEEAPEEEDDDDFLKTIKYRPLAPE